jgi:hypothetical protein
MTNPNAYDQKDLLNYIREINESSDGGFALTESLEHWAGYNIYTRVQLGDYLDECVQQERDEDDIVEDHEDFSCYDPIEPTWDAVSRHDMNEGW